MIKRNSFKALLLLICALIIFNCTSNIGYIQDNLENQYNRIKALKSEQSYNESVERNADYSTVDNYKNIITDEDVGDRYNGRVWADKSVYAHDNLSNSNVINLDNKFDISFQEDFLHVFSVLGSSQIVKQYPPSPIDLVISLDMSASMAQDIRYPINNFGDPTNGSYAPKENRTMKDRIANSRIKESIDAINEVIDNLMKQNINNRVSVIVSGAGAQVLMPLAHYKKIDDNPYIKINGFETLYTLDDLTYDAEYGLLWTRNIDCCFVVEANAYKDDNDDPTFSDKNIYKYSISNNVNNTKVKAYPGYDLQTEENLNKGLSNDKKELSADFYIGYLTNTQGGIYLANSQLAKESKTTYSVTPPNYSTITVARIPATIIISDGGANFAFNKMNNWENIYADYDPEGYNWSAHFVSDEYDSEDLSHRLDMNIGTEWYEVYLPGIEDDNIIFSLYNIGMVEEDGTLRTVPEWCHAGVFYSNDNDPFGTSGSVLQAVMTASYMKTAVVKHYEQGWDEGGASQESRISPKTFTMSVDATGIPQWGKMRLYPILDPGSNIFSDIPNWWENETLFGPELSGYGSITKKTVYDGLLTSWNKWSNGEDAQANMCIGQQKAAMIPISPEKEYNEKFNVIVTNEDVKNNIIYNDAFYDISSSNISKELEKILYEITAEAFSPIGGQNDVGISNSITYTDPIGKYMEVKDVTNLLLFGNNYPVTKTGVYDANFNMNGHGNGWYDENGNYLGTSGSWDSGDTYYLSKEYIEGSGDQEGFLPEGYLTSSDTLKNVVFTLYRLNISNSDRTMVRSNPSYGDDQYMTYKLSDIRIWVEDSGEYDTDESHDVDSLYDEALHINIPNNAIPLKVDTFEVDQFNTVFGYSTNIGTDSALPLRVAYTVGISDEIINESTKKIDLSKISREYFVRNTKIKDDSEYIYFYSNYYSKENYRTSSSNTFGNAYVTFSPSDQNRFYVFQNNLTIYKNSSGGEGETVNSGGTIKLSDPVKNLDEIDLDSTYYIEIDYFLPQKSIEGRAGKQVKYAVARKGSDFFGENGEKYITYFDETTKKELDEPNSNTVVATKVGGKRVGDLKNLSTQKKENITDTSSLVYAPEYGNNSSENSYSLINWLGNNGYIAVQQTWLFVTKQVNGKSSQEYEDIVNNEVFNFEVSFFGDAPDKEAIINKYQTEIDTWIPQVGNAYVVTDNEGWLLDLNNSRTKYWVGNDESSRLINDNGTIVAYADSSKQGEEVILVYEDLEKLNPLYKITVEMKTQTIELTEVENSNEVRAKFTLKNGEGILFSGLNSDTKYVVKEVLSQDNLDNGFNFERVTQRNSDNSTIEDMIVTGTTDTGLTDEVHYFNIFSNDVIDFKFKKVESENLNNKITGTKFELYKLVCDNPVHTATDHDKLINTNNVSECFQKVDEQISGELDSIDENVKFESLEVGEEYRLIETKATSNRIKPEGQWKIIFESGKTVPTITAIGDKLPPAFIFNEDGSLSLPNVAIFEFPISGNIGTTIFYITGLILLFIGVNILYYNKYKVSNNLIKKYKEDKDKNEKKL